MCDIPCATIESESSDSFSDEFLFLISTTNPWYGYLLIYLQTQRFQLHLSRDDRHHIWQHAKYYLILHDTLYRRGIDSVLRRCLTHEEAEHMLHDCHSKACGGHLSGMATAQKILHAGYFWPSIFKDYREAVNKYPPCQHFYPKKCTHPSPLHPVITIGPFSQWGVDFMHCNPSIVDGHGYIIISIDYFTKWANAMPIYAQDGKTIALFLFNHVIARFGVP